MSIDNATIEERYDRLCDEMFEIVTTVLTSSTRDEVARGWLEEAVALVDWTSLGASSPDAEASALQELHDILEQAEPTIGPSEHRCKDITEALVGGWLDVLRETLAGVAKIRLDSGLFPAALAVEIDERWKLVLKQTGLTDQERQRIWADFRTRIEDRQSLHELPLVGTLRFEADDVFLVSPAADEDEDLSVTTAPLPLRAPIPLATGGSSRSEGRVMLCAASTRGGGAAGHSGETVLTVRGEDGEQLSIAWLESTGGWTITVRRLPGDEANATPRRAIQIRLLEERDETNEVDSFVLAADKDLDLWDPPRFGDGMRFEARAVQDEG